MACIVKCIVFALFSTIFALVTPLAQAQMARAQVVASNLQNPWALAFLPGGRFLVTERPGRLRVIEPNGELTGSLKFAYLNRVELSQPFGGKVISEHKLLEDLGQRIRDVRQGPDGWLYVLTDNARGQLIRLVPQ
jgi:glucose/arabinose dehydrogenase